MPRVVEAVPITPEAFAPFGDVVSAGLRAGADANQGTAKRYDFAARLETTRPGAAPNLAVFRSRALSLPLEIALLERHPASTQTFLPMICARYLVCVAPNGPGGEPDESLLSAFVCGPGQGVSYRRGVWHHPILALDAQADFAMLAWEDGGELDCEERRLVEPIGLVLSARVPPSGGC